MKLNFLLILHNHEKYLYWVYNMKDETVSNLLMLQKYINRKQKILKEKDYALGLGNNSKDFTINNRKK